MKTTSIITPLILASLLLSACGGGTEESGTAPSGNRAPIISGSPITSVEAGNPYSFTPTASDLDGDNLTFNIENLPGWATFDNATGLLSGIPDLIDQGTYEDIIIRVTDGTASAALPPYSILVATPTISQNYSARVSNGLDDAEESPDGSMYLDSSDLELVNDGSNQLIGLRFGLNVPQGAQITEANLQFTVDEVTNDATDLVIWAQAIDDAPGFTANTGDISGRASTLATVAWSPEPWLAVGDSAEAQSTNNLNQLIEEIVNRPGWRSGNHIALVISGTGVRTAVAYDGNHASAPLLNIRYIGETPNSPPTIQGVPDTGVTVGIEYSFSPIASDPDGDTLIYSIANLPSWVSFDSTTGNLTGTPQATDVGSYNNITISVSDGEDNVSLEAFNISVSETNHAPVISGNPPTSVAELGAYSFAPVANDVDGDPVSFSITNLPNWASFDVTSGTISGTPGYSDAGSYNTITISVSDGAVTSSLNPFNITVTNNNRPPVISGTPATSINEGSMFSFSPTASDLDGETLSFSISNLPSWASFDPNSGRISGTPDYESAGNYPNIVVTVTDGSASDSLSPFAITVGDINRVPSISGSPALSTQADSLYTFTPTAADEDNDALIFSIGNIPSWAVFNTATGQLSGTPSDSDVGLYTNITISVSDGTDSATLSAFVIAVNSKPVSISGNIFVDSLIGTNYCEDYNASSRACGDGDKKVYKSLASAASIAIAGDIVEIRGGSYNESLNPGNSGNSSSPITFRAYNNENAIITGSSLTPAIDISDRSYLILEGLEVTNVRRWLYAVNSHHNIIRNNSFSGANDSGGSSKTGLFFQEATYNKILDNVIDDSTQDNIALIKSDNNIVANNTITNAAHTLWAIKCGNRNVIRNNYFYNPEQKIGEIYDCDDVGFDHEFFLHNSTKRNIVENNIFAKSSSYYSPSGGNGIQYSAQNGIIRFNVFYENNVGLGMQHYSPEALYNYSNRVYHNTFYNNLCGGVSTTDPSTPDYSDNLFVNNIFYKNHECGGVSPYQLVYRNGLGGFQFISNNLFSGVPADSLIGAWQGSGNTLQWFETNYPGLFSSNLEISPDFVNESSYDFRLNPSSPMVNAGRFLTSTTNSGSGSTITVQDANYFYDGFGIEGETGDYARLEGRDDILEIISVDYTNNKVTVNKQVTWTAGQGFSLEYTGTAPDLGAYEAH